MAGNQGCKIKFQDCKEAKGRRMMKARSNKSLKL